MFSSVLVEFEELFLHEVKLNFEQIKIVSYSEDQQTPVLWTSDVF